jgi:hypothetical protein
MVERLFKFKLPLSKLLSILIKQLLSTIAWQSSLEDVHQGESCLNQHKEGQVFKYLCQLCTHGETDINVIKGMGKAWLFMKTLEQHVLSLRNPPF